MGRLAGRGLAPRLAASAARLAPQAGGEQRVRYPWRKWYFTARWRRLREAVLLRDNWTCRQTGVLLVGRAPASDSPVVDHIRPHRGDPDLFWAMDNLQAVSKAWHDSEKQRQERAQGASPWA